LAARRLGESGEPGIARLIDEGRILNADSKLISQAVSGSDEFAFASA
jgi:hypothetical protein